jgi:hypothetical protein
MFFSCVACSTQGSGEMYSEICSENLTQEKGEPGRGWEDTIQMDLK